MRRLIIFAVCGGLAAAYGLARLSAGDAKAGPEFDRDIWTSETRIHDEDAPRLAMIEAVLARLEHGMSRDAVTALLGSPTETPYFRHHDLVYWLGQEPGYLDSSWLVMDFAAEDDAGLTHARVMTD